MDPLKPEPGSENFSGNSNTWNKRLLLLFAIFLLISVSGHFIVDDHWIKIITNHLGGLGITGLFACLASFIAKHKGYNYWKVFKISLLVPILIGLVAVLFISLKANFLYCGGGFSLLSSLLLVIIVLIMKREKMNV